MATPAVRQLQDERFLLLETLGRGGMASVYRAFDRVDQQVVALKVQMESQPGGPQHPFATEYDAWSRLSHPNIVRALELCRSRSGPIPANTPYLVLEHIAGRPAHKVLQPGLEPPAAVESFAAEVLRGLSHVHQAGFVHRDMKPSNVLVETGATGRSIKLTDFGLAIRQGTADEPGCISGSLPYVSPEALCGQNLDGRADLYGLGILLYLLTSGTMPLKDSEGDAWVRWHLTGPPLDSTLGGRCSTPRLARFIRRLTDRDREQRPADATEALTLLDPRCSQATPSAPQALSRSLRAKLRLTLDAVRLGAIRVARCPSGARNSRIFRREAAVAAQILGLDYYEIIGREGAATDLDRLVVRLLEARAADPVATLRRFELDRILRITLVGDLPVLDPTRTLEPASGHGGHSEEDSSLARFFLQCARRRPLVFTLGRAAREGDPRVTALCNFLQDVARRSDRPCPGQGGLLLLLD